MKFTIPYQTVQSPQQAYSSIHQYIHSGAMSEQDLAFELEEKEFDWIHSKGKGFSLQAQFAEKEIELELKLSLLLKPFAKKIRQKIIDDISMLV